MNEFDEITRTLQLEFAEAMSGSRSHEYTHGCVNSRAAVAAGHVALIADEIDVSKPNDIS